MKKFVLTFKDDGKQLTMEAAHVHAEYSFLVFSDGKKEPLAFFPSASLLMVARSDVAERLHAELDGNPQRRKNPATDEPGRGF